MRELPGAEICINSSLGPAVSLACSCSIMLWNQRNSSEMQVVGENLSFSIPCVMQTPGNYPARTEGHFLYR